MSKVQKVVFFIAIGIVITLGIWIVVLQGKLNNINIDKKDYWEEQYILAQDSINKINIERSKLAIERDDLHSKRDYWKNQYRHADSLLNNVKSRQNEKLDIIRNADANKLNSLLSDRIRQISSNRE